MNSDQKRWSPSTKPASPTVSASQLHRYHAHADSYLPESGMATTYFYTQETIKLSSWHSLQQTQKWTWSQVLHVVHILHADRVRAGWWSRSETWLLLYHCFITEEKLSNCSVFFRPFSVFNYNFKHIFQKDCQSTMWWMLKKNFILKDSWMSTQAEQNACFPPSRKFSLFQLFLRQLLFHFTREAWKLVIFHIS